MRRPPWVAIGARHCPSPGPLILADAVTARALRKLVARTLHEPLRGALGASESPLAGAAAAAVEALLPGNPKPVALLTQMPRIIGNLLGGALDPDDPRHDEALQCVAADVVFALTLSGLGPAESNAPIRLRGPARLDHVHSRRMLILEEGEEATFGTDLIRVDGEPLDPWGERLTPEEALRLEFGGVRTCSTLGALPFQEAFERLEGLGISSGAALESLVSMVPRADWPQDGEGLPLALFEARIPETVTDPDSLARALAEEVLIHRLAAARLVDPLVVHEEDLPALVTRVRRYLDAPSDTKTKDASVPELTELGHSIWGELETR